MVNDWSKVANFDNDGVLVVTSAHVLGISEERLQSTDATGQIFEPQVCPDVLQACLGGIECSLRGTIALMLWPVGIEVPCLSDLKFYEPVREV